MIGYCTFCKKNVQVKELGSWYQSEGGMWLRLRGSWCSKCGMIISPSNTACTRLETGTANADSESNPAVSSGQRKSVLRLFEEEGNMAISKLLGEGVNGHMHNYEESASGYWEWCNDCQCMVTSPCLHNEYLCCYERSAYIRLKRKYEAVEHGVQPTIESGGKKPAKKSKRKGVAPAKSG